MCDTGSLTTSHLMWRRVIHWITWEMFNTPYWKYLIVTLCTHAFLSAVCLIKVWAVKDFHFIFAHLSIPHLCRGPRPEIQYRRRKIKQELSMFDQLHISVSIHHPTSHMLLCFYNRTVSAFLSLHDTSAQHMSCLHWMSTPIRPQW